MKVKIFRFIESKNLYENNISNQKVNQGDFDKYGDIINNFIEDKEVINIEVNTIQAHYHNNCGYHENHIIFTILYK